MIWNFIGIFKTNMWNYYLFPYQWPSVSSLTAFPQIHFLSSQLFSRSWACNFKISILTFWSYFCRSFSTLLSGHEFWPWFLFCVVKHLSFKGIQLCKSWRKWYSGLKGSHFLRSSPLHSKRKWNPSFHAEYQATSYCCWNKGNDPLPLLKK